MKIFWYSDIAPLSTDSGEKFHEKNGYFKIKCSESKKIR